MLAVAALAAPSVWAASDQIRPQWRTPPSYRGRSGLRRLGALGPEKGPLFLDWLPTPHSVLGLRGRGSEHSVIYVL